MRVALTLIFALALPATASAQANQTSRSFTEDVGRRVTCTVGQVGSRHTRGVAIMGRTGSTVDNDPSDALWERSGCGAEMRLTPDQRAARAMAAIEAGPYPGAPRPGEPDTRFADIMADINRHLGRNAPSQATPAHTEPNRAGGGTYLVAAGDTISGISRRFGVPIAEIEQANQRVLTGALIPGTGLVLPATASDRGNDPYATGRIASPN